MPLIPVPAVRLPPWSDQVRSGWATRGEQAAALGRGAGVGRQFGQLVAEARRLLLAGDVQGLNGRLAEPRFVRALVTAWLDDAALARETLSPPLVSAILVRARLSRLTTIAAAELFFTYFDRLDTWHEGLFTALRDLVRRAVAAQRPGRSSDLIESIREHDSVLLERDGPIRLADGLLSSGADVTSWFREHHLAGYADSRFGRIARDAYYLRAIEAADATQGEHRFLVSVASEVLTRQRTESTQEDRVYFGHQVLTALTAKPTRHPSTAWLRAALDIGGDPRLTQTADWRMWWSMVPEGNRERAVRWMRGVDLHAFLDGVEQYARATHNHAMVAMLERRSRLLIGLYEQDRIEDVRLILGEDIGTWIRRTARVPLVEEALLRGSSKQDTAVIYVDCGDFCLVEGSHNVTLHVYIGGPIARLADRGVREFEYADLREVLPERHKRAHGPDAYLGVPHKGGEWIRKALDFLHEHGVTLEERGLMTPGDFVDLSLRRAGRY